MGGTKDMAVDAIEVHRAAVKEETLKTGLIIKIEEPAVVSLKETFSIVAEDGTIIEVKDIVIREEGEDGTLISNIMTQGTNNRPNLTTPITITHHRWDSNTATQSHMNNIHIPNNNNNTHHK